MGTATTPFMSMARPAALTTTNPGQRKMHTITFLDAQPTLSMINITEAMIDTILPKTVFANTVRFYHHVARRHGLVQCGTSHTRAKETSTIRSTSITGTRASALDHGMRLHPIAASHLVDATFDAPASHKYLRFARPDVVGARCMIARSIG
ncbi:hypothetical protein DPSP01_005832 [Paraphaeosphaeria sporulosa]